MNILQIVTPPAGYVNVFRGEDGLAYSEPVLALALIQTGAHQSIEAVGTTDGELEVLHPDTHDNFLGTYFSNDPALARLYIALENTVSEKTKKSES
jgi:hypothetical protein